MFQSFFVYFFTKKEKLWNTLYNPIYCLIRIYRDNKFEYTRYFRINDNKKSKITFPDYSAFPHITLPGLGPWKSVISRFFCIIKISVLHIFTALSVYNTLLGCRHTEWRSRFFFLLGLVGGLVIRKTLSGEYSSA